MRKTILITALTFSILTFGQSNAESEIIISEENLIALIQKLKQKKQENIAAQKQLVNSNTSVDNTVVYNIKEKPTQKPVDNSAKLDAISSKLLSLEYELKYLTSQLAYKNNTNSKQELIVIGGNEAQKTETVYTENPEIAKLRSDLTLLETTYKSNLEKQKLDSKNKELAAKNEALKKELDAKKAKLNQVVVADKAVKQQQKEVNSNLNTNQTTPIASKSLVDQNNAKVNKVNVDPNKGFDEFKESYNKPQSTNQTIVYDSSYESNYKDLVEKYGSIKKQVFFGNNDTSLGNNDVELLRSIVATLDNEPNIDVYLIGFASQKGNALYNQKLSAKRTEVIKEFLISKGIHPTRILSQYHGIDYKSNSEENARRVDVSYIVRR